MSDLNLLDNRSDLEKLEQDLAALSQTHTATPGVQQRLQKARHDLEMARAAHIELCYQLNHPDTGQRAAARRQLQQRIAAGETKIYDPHAAAWRPAAELVLESIQRDEDARNREIEFRQVEADLMAAVDTPRGLKELSILIPKVEEVERQTSLTTSAQAALQQVRRAFNVRQKEQRHLTLLLHSGSLTERVWAIKELRRLIENGETEILEAPAETWRPADLVLNDAMIEYEFESARIADQVLHKAAEQYRTHPDLVLSTLYKAMDKNIPYTAADRQRLENLYLERYAKSHRPGRNTQPDDDHLDPPDLEGFKKVYEAKRSRLLKLFNRSFTWLNQFFRSTVTPNMTKLLAQAEDKNTDVGKAVEIIQMAEILAQKQLEGSLEIPEVQLRGAKILFNKNEPRNARDYLEKALPLYTLERWDKIHRHAVTAWLLGCLEYYLGNPFNGYSLWKEARSLFEELQGEALRARQKEKLDWYKARLIEMETYRIQTFEMIYFNWMNQYGTPVLPQWFTEYRQMMDTQLSQKKIIELRETIKMMLRNAERENNPEIGWHARVEAAFFEYQQDDYKKAIAHLEQAAIGYQFNHSCAVTLWLLGMIRWWLPTQRDDAILNWEDSIRRFVILAQDADKTNQQSRRIWYEAQIDLMKTSLRQWITLTKTV